MIGSNPFPQNLKYVVIRGEKCVNTFCIINSTKLPMALELPVLPTFISRGNSTVANSTVLPLHFPSVSKQIHLVSDQP